MGDVVEQRAHFSIAVVFAFAAEMRDARFFRVDSRSSQIFRRNIHKHNRFDDFRAGDKKFAYLIDCKDKIGDARRIHGASRAGACDDRNLRHRTGCADVLIKEVSVAAQRVDTFLNACSAGIVYTDNGAPRFDRLVDEFGDFFAVHETERAALHRKILSVYRDRPPVYLSESGDDAVVGQVFFFHTEARAVMAHTRIDFHKRIFIAQSANPFDCVEFSFFVLFFDIVFHKTIPRFKIM